MPNGTGLDSPLWSWRWAVLAVVLAIALGAMFS